MFFGEKKRCIVSVNKKIERPELNFINKLDRTIFEMIYFFRERLDLFNLNSIDFLDLVLLRHEQFLAKF